MWHTWCSRCDHVPWFLNRARKSITSTISEHPNSALQVAFIYAGTVAANWLSITDRTEHVSGLVVHWPEHKVPEIIQESGSYVGLAATNNSVTTSDGAREIRLSCALVRATNVDGSTANVSGGRVLWGDACVVTSVEACDATQSGVHRALRRESHNSCAAHCRQPAEGWQKLIP